MFPVLHLEFLLQDLQLHKQNYLNNKVVSNDLVLWVIAPTEILFTPVLDICLILFKVAFPEYSVSYLFLQSFKQYFNCEDFILSKSILLNFKPKICLSWFTFSTSTVTIFFVFIAFSTNSLRLDDALIWLSLIRISSLKLYLWL